MSSSTTEQVQVDTIEVGDFFVSSWGYDQTNIDFYKVVGITPSGKSVKVQEWSSKRVEEEDGHFTQEAVVPGENPRTWHFRGNDEPTVAKVETKRLRYWGSRPSFSVNSFANAYKWDGKVEHKTASGYGH